MCCNEKSCCCEFPEKLKGTPADCSEEQIQECHGEGEGHQCCHEQKEEK
ncbi:MAG: hypothetical protein SVW57_14535 [Thermodesulfobacteriota bacterium]|nr:hypothetical protein [Thermodesulfobacteriota bacterium]